MNMSATVLVGDGIAAYRALAIKHGLQFWMKHRMPINRLYTPKNLMAVTSQITGRKFKRGQYIEAIKALDEYLAEIMPD